jgi:hypothetical protein
MYGSEDVGQTSNACYYHKDPMWRWFPASYFTIRRRRHVKLSIVITTPGNWNIPSLVLGLTKLGIRRGVGLPTV